MSGPKHAQTNLSDDVTIYTVQSGDSLSSIASQFRTTWKALQKLNDISDPNGIYVGQQLRVTETSAPPLLTVYTVRVGDTLNDIAKRFNTSRRTLQKLNNLRNPNKIFAGQQLRIG